MKKKRRKKRTFDAAFKAQAVDRVLRGRANQTETQRAIADDLEVTENQLSAWVKASGKKKANGSAEVPSPTLRLEGLRSWVNHAVRLEFDRLLAEKGLGEE